MTKIKLGEIEAEVTFKAIKNVHLSVHPPLGRVRISAPTRMKLDTVRVFAISKLGWIKQQQRKLAAQERETSRDYVNRESHYVWGKRVLLTVVEKEQPPSVSVRVNKMTMSVRPGADRVQRQEILERWYREQLRLEVPKLIARWEKHLGVKVERFFVQRMKTRWGKLQPDDFEHSLEHRLGQKAHPVP